MAIKPSVNYPTKTTAPDANYPYGSARNVSAPGDGTGTPLEEAWVNDFFGFSQKLTDAAGVTPSGNPETILASDLFDSIEKTFSRFSMAVDTGTANTRILASVSGADPDTLVDGMRIGFFNNATNTTTATAKLGTLTTKFIRLRGAVLSGGEMKAGDFVEIVFNVGANYWEIAQAAPVSGSVVGGDSFSTGASNTGIILLPPDNTIPLSGEGDQYMQLAYAATKATNKLKIDVVAQLASTNINPQMQAALFKDAVAGSIGAGFGGRAAFAGARCTVSFTVHVTPGTTASVLYKVRAGSGDAGTTTINGSFGGVSASSITITETEA
jgi:hypothetical protein